MNGTRGGRLHLIQHKSVFAACQVYQDLLRRQALDRHKAEAACVWLHTLAATYQHKLHAVQAGHVSQLFASAADKHAAAMRGVQEQASAEADSDAQWLRNSSQEVQHTRAPPPAPLLLSFAVPFDVGCNKVLCLRKVLYQ